MKRKGSQILVSRVVLTIVFSFFITAATVQIFFCVCIETNYVASEILRDLNWSFLVLYSLFDFVNKFFKKIKKQSRYIF